MKHITFLLALFLGFTLTIPAAAQKTYAVVVGISNYPGEDLDVGQTTKDAKKIAKILKTHTPNVVLLTSKFATKENVIKTLEEISKYSKENDQIIFSYSGHGAPNNMCLYDEQYPYLYLFETLKKAKAKQKICIFNACHSGSSAYGSKVANDSSLVIIASSRPEEVSYEATHLGAGFLNQAIAKGLRGNADTDGNRKLDIEELFKFCFKDVQLKSNSAQHPQLICREALKKAIILEWK